MHLHALGGICLLFLPLSAALPGPAAPIAERDALNLYERAIIPGVDDPTSHSSQAATTSQAAAPSSTPEAPQSTSTTSSSTSSSVPTSSSAPSSTQSTTTTQSTRAVSTNDDGQVVTLTVQVPASTTSSSATAAPTGDDDSSGPGKGTWIGIGVAGGVAVLGLAGFIIWKFTQKRFSSFDDDGEDIKWPMPKEELQPPAAPSMVASANATNSSVDLTADPYAVPPLPVRSTPYYDDPSGTAAAAYYDPYRGPVPQTFHSPPGSTEGHHPPYAGGEAIPMSTYSSTSGRQSPGPNMAYDDGYNRSRSPGPNMAYDDPYAGRRSPGPSLAYGVDPMRTGTPVSMAPPRMGTPLGAGYGAPPNVPPGLDIPRTGTPQSYGRASPAIPGGYGAQAPLVNPYGRGTPNPYGP